MNVFRKSKMWAAALALMLGVGLVAGCGGSKDAGKTAEVQGTVTAAGSTAL